MTNKVSQANPPEIEEPTKKALEAWEEFKKLQDFNIYRAFMRGYNAGFKDGEKK